jgi:hypothetical protein
VNRRGVITINLSGRGSPDRYPTLPVKIIDADGQVKARTSITTLAPTTVSFDRTDAPLFAKLYLPSGKTEILPLCADGAWTEKIEFSVGTESPGESMAWSVMRIDLNRKLGPLMKHPGMQDAWLQMWELDNGSRHWKQVPLNVTQTVHSDLAVQLELPRSQQPRALVTSLGATRPQVISLPPRRELMVLVTTGHSVSLQSAARVLVRGYGADAEGILEFLGNGSIDAVDTVLDPDSAVAKRLLQDKVQDPIAATAAAYYLLRKRDWERLPQQWLVNLAKWFSWIPDTHLIRDASQIQRGMDSKEAPALAAKSLQDTLALGLPFFAEAASLMEELLYYAQRSSRPRDQNDNALIAAMLAARNPAGLTFGFFGEAPSEPLTPLRMYSKGLRTLPLGAKLMALGRETLVLANVIATTAIAGRLNVARGRKLTTEFVLMAGDVLGSIRRRVPGSTKKTFFLRNVYGPGSPPSSLDRLLILIWGGRCIAVALVIGAVWQLYPFSDLSSASQPLFHSLVATFVWVMVEIVCAKTALDDARATLKKIEVTP